MRLQALVVHVDIGICYLDAGMVGQRGGGGHNFPETHFGFHVKI